MSNQWASPGGLVEILAFPFFPISESPSSWEDLGLTMRMGVWLVGMVEGVGIWVLEAVAICWDEESKRNASDSYVEEHWALASDVEDAEERDIFCESRRGERLPVFWKNNEDDWSNDGLWSAIN